MFAFIGGLDLCWGRYDSCNHLLSEPKNENEIYHWPGIDYSNCRIKDFENVQDPYKELIDRNSVPRLPWHDVQVLLEGPVVGDICRHFIERWNYSISNATFKNAKKNTIIRGKNDQLILMGVINKLLEVFTTSNFLKKLIKTYILK
jgi:phosphatidylserine/phosphatidylglycerophosphate/cardiolipin synthase-like enzyme